MQSCLVGVKPDFPLGPLGRTEALISRNSFGAAGQSPGEIEQAAAQSRVVDPVVGADQLDGLPPAQRIGVERFGRGLSKSCRDRRRTHRVHVVKKNETGTSSTRLRSCNRLAPIRLAPRSYFWTC